jgi:hypothetical protein
LTLTGLQADKERKDMQRIFLIAVFAAASIGMSAATASAQMWPGSRRSYSSYDTWGYNDDAVAAAYALNSSNNAARNTAQSYQAWSQRAAPTSGMQSDIRNTMDASAQRRTQDIYSQQQAGRDWWFQVQQQQMAQQRAQAPQYSAVPAGFESLPAPVAPKAATDIIKWLPLLQAPQFAAERARVEAPYRRSSKGLSRPTAEDYQDMIKAAEQMKRILKGMTANITAQEYLNAEAFLDKLAAEARDRLGQATPKK